MPLLIGGATTSRVHTAVRIAPGVLAAGGPRGRRVARGGRRGGRSWTRAGATPFVGRDARGVRGRAPRPRGSGRARAAAVARGGAREPPRPIDWRAGPPPRPVVPGRPDLRAPTRSTSSWSGSTGRPFFATWELTGAYPAILDDPARRAGGARAVSPTPGRCSSGSSTSGCCRRARSVGFWPANATPDDDIVLCADEDARRPSWRRLHTLRQQMAKTDGPAEPGPGRLRRAARVRRRGLHRRVRGHRGARHRRGSCTASRPRHDDYSAIMAKALADRLAEAFAERLHERVRRELWGYAPDEALANDDLIAERYQGIRPRPATRPRPTTSPRPSCSSCSTPRRGPGISLTESMAMLPARVRVRPLPVAPGGALLRRRADGRGPAGGLRAPGRDAARRGGALAVAEPRGRRSPLTIPGRRATTAPAEPDRRRVVSCDIRWPRSPSPAAASAPLPCSSRRWRSCPCPPPSSPLHPR